MIILALGANVAGPWGTPRATIRRALRELEIRGIRVERCSQLYVTAPYGPVPQPDFINAATRIATALPPLALLHSLKAIEREAGRRPGKRWGPRCLDIDIIDYHSRRMGWNASVKPGGSTRTPAPPNHRPPLVLPHPDLHCRAFVLLPLYDIAPRWHHPVTGASLSQLIAALRLRNKIGVVKTAEELSPSS